MFYGKFADQRDNQIDSPNRYNVEGNNSLSLGRQPELCWKSGYLSNFIIYAGKYLVFFYKTNNKKLSVKF